MSKPFSISFGAKKSAPPPPKKRLHSSLADGSDSDEEQARGQPQAVLEFNANGAVEKAPLVIKRQKNVDWRVEAQRKKGKNLLPAEELARRSDEVQGGKEDGRDKDIELPDEQKRTYGLVVYERRAESNGDGQGYRDLVDAQEERKLKTADEEALDALVNGKKQDFGLVIPAQDSSRDEERQFHDDVDSRPDGPTLEDYAAVPVEEFGRAILRGLGWKDGDELRKGSNPTKKPVRRQHKLLGIGAKVVPELAPPPKYNKEKATYSPFVMRNTKTNQKLTEDEYKDLESKGGKENRDDKSRRDKDHRESRGHREDRDDRDRRERREERRERDHRDRRDRDDRDDRERREERDRREYREDRERREHREDRGHRDRREYRDYKDRK